MPDFKNRPTFNGSNVVAVADFVANAEFGLDLGDSSPVIAATKAGSGQHMNLLAQMVNLLPELFPSGLVLNGLTMLTGTGLQGLINAGSAYDGYQKINILSTVSKTFTASRDTYVDFGGSDGINPPILVYNEVANGAAQPAITAGYVRLGKVVTGAAAITSITDMRKLVADTTKINPGSGTRDGTKVLRDDLTWQAPAAGGGYTPPWVRTGAGVHYTSWGNGDPFLVNRLLDAGLSPTRTQMVGPVSPAVLFRLPVALSVSTIYVPTLVAANANNVIYVAIYRRDTGALVTSGSMGTASVVGWSGIALSPAVALSANTDYWFAYHGSTSSNTTAIIRTPNNPFATWVYGAPAGPVADYGVGIPIQVQFSVTTLGVWPDPMPAISAMAQTNRGAMLAMLEGTGS